MHTTPSSHRARRARSSARTRLVAAFCAIAAILSGASLLRSGVALAGDAIQLAHLSEENLPAQDMPSMVATPQASPDGDWEEVPDSAPSGSDAAPNAVNSPAAPVGAPSAAETNAAQVEPTPVATPTDVAPLEVGSVAPQGEISDSSLDREIQRVSATDPALAASLRVADQAREQILKGQEGDALQILQRAISIDASNPYAYFYLGRANLEKKNYDQALTFFTRAETQFGGNPQWLGETLAFEGLVNERSGQTAPAIACYQKALVAVPGNLMARVGLTRLSGEQAAPAIQPASAPAGPPDAAPEGDAIQPPPDSAPPPPAPAPDNSSAPPSKDL
jgi:TolA-binding protein